MTLKHESQDLGRNLEDSLADNSAQDEVIDDNYDKTPREPAFKGSSDLPLGHIALVGDFPTGYGNDS